MISGVQSPRRVPRIRSFGKSCAIRPQSFAPPPPRRRAVFICAAKRKYCLPVTEHRRYCGNCKCIRQKNRNTKVNLTCMETVHQGLEVKGSFPRSRPRHAEVLARAWHIFGRDVPGPWGVQTCDRWVPCTLGRQRVLRETCAMQNRQRSVAAKLATKLELSVPL